MSAGAFDIMSFLPIVLLLGVFYFLLIRPQQKKMKTHQDMLTSIRRGDKVVTNGGLIGEVTKVISDQELQLEIAESVRVRVARQMINSVVTKSTLGGDSTGTSANEKEDGEVVSLPTSKLKTPVKKLSAKTPLSKAKKK